MGSNLAAQTWIVKPGQLPGKTTCWEIPQPRHSAFLSPTRCKPGSDGMVLGWHQEDEDIRARNLGQSHPRLALRSELRPRPCKLFGIMKQSPVRRAGGLEAGMGSTSENHEVVLFMLASRCKSDCEKQKASWRLPGCPPPPCTPTPCTFFLPRNSPYYFLKFGKVSRSLDVLQPRGC